MYLQTMIITCLFPIRFKFKPTRNCRSKIKTHLFILFFHTVPGTTSAFIHGRSSLCSCHWRTNRPKHIESIVFEPKSAAFAYNKHTQQRQSASLSRHADGSPSSLPDRVSNDARSIDHSRQQHGRNWGCVRAVRSAATAVDQHRTEGSHHQHLIVIIASSTTV